MINIKTIGSGSSGNCYVISDGATQIMIEAGVPFKHVQPAMGFDFSHLSGVLISHEHGDHSQYLDQLTKRTTAPIFATRGTMHELKLLPDYRHHIIKSLDPFVCGTWKIIPFTVQHDAAEPVGFMIENSTGERLIYVTDTYYVKYRFSHINYMMVEMNYSRKIAAQNVAESQLAQWLEDRIFKSHFELENSLDFINKNKSPELKEVTLIHLSDANSDEKLFKQRTQAITGVPVHVAPKRSW